MAAVGGSIASVDLDGRNFPVAADADSGRKIGGFENEVEANGDGSARLKKTRVPFSINGLAVEIDDTRGDQEFLQSLQNQPNFFPGAVTYASGEVYQGSMQITGETPTSSQSATAEINLSGTATLTKQ